MNELIIDDKKYIPSKQAAKITGYAKDYIGQLCREGRVPARLVGRSWYVLESAIRDHRFGDKNHAKHEHMKHDEVTVSVSHSEDTNGDGKQDTHQWGSVHYEADETEPLPQAGHSKVMPESEVASGATIPGNMHEAWQEWFSRVTDSIASADETRLPSESVPVKDEDSETENVPIRVVSHDSAQTTADDAAKNIDISDSRSVHLSEHNENPDNPDAGSMSPGTLETEERPRVPERVENEGEKASTGQQTTFSVSRRAPELSTVAVPAAKTPESAVDADSNKDQGSSVKNRHSHLYLDANQAIRIVGVLVAVSAVVLILAGSGFMDSTAGSFAPAAFLSGVSIYNI